MSRHKQVFALGGHVMRAGERANDHLLDLTGASSPRVLLLPTATGDSDSYIARFHEAFPSRRVRATHVKLFGIPPPDLRDLILEQDAIFVGGGNTANMLAVWKLHGVDEYLREAWEAGVVLSGVSAGSICWFEAGITDSFRAELDGLECLGFLAGSNCPHYDGEEQRRPAYHRLVREGMPAGIAAEDFVGLHYVDDALAEAVTWRGSRAYRVELADGVVRETPLETRQL